MRKLVLLLLLGGVASAQAETGGEGFTFKGNSLGMTLEQVRANMADLGVVYVNTGKPNFLGKSDPKKTVAVKLPICTDHMRGFPGDTFDLADGEVLCNADPKDKYSDALMVAGKPVLQAIYRFYHGRLYSIQLAFPEDRLGEIELAFDAKYGARSRPQSNYVDGIHERALWVRGSQVLTVNAGDKLYAPANALFFDATLAPPRKATDF